MSQRSVMRELRKEMLCLQAEQHRRVLLSELQAGQRTVPDSSAAEKEFAPWLEIASGVLGALLPARWGRWFKLGLSAWQVSRRVSALRKTGV